MKTAAHRPMLTGYPEFTLARGAATMLIPTALQKFVVYKRDTQHRTAGTQRNYHNHVTGFARWCQVTYGKQTCELVTTENINTYLHSQQQWSEGTRSLASILLKEFAQWGAEEDHCYWQPKAIKGLVFIKPPKRKARPYKPDERQSMFALTLSTQDACCRALLYHGALRNAEVRGIRLKDITAPHRLPTGEQILGRLYVFGKGSKERVIEIHPELWEFIAAQLAEIPAKTDLTRTLLAKTDGKPWTAQMLWTRVRAWGKKAGIEGRVHPHRWRHTGATDLLENSADKDLSALQAFMGHSSIVTTQGYAHVVNERVSKLVRGLPRVTPTNTPVTLPAPKASE